MNAFEFVCFQLGLTKAESNFIDELGKRFSYFDLVDEDVEDFISYSPNHKFLQNFLISRIFDRVIDYYCDGTRVEKPLNRDNFSYDLNSICSTLWYDGENIESQEVLEEMTSGND